MPAYTTEEFNALSPAEQRRAIARDAIAQLKIGQFEANHIYLSGTLDLNAEERAKQEPIDLQSLLIAGRANCRVCALGACFLSVVRLSNEVSVPPWSAFYSQHVPFYEKIGKHFCYEQHRLIEGTYEGFNLNSGGMTDDSGASYQFYKRYEDSTERLLAILQRIADDEQGEFHP